MEMVPMKKIEIVLDSAAVDDLTEILEKAGATGYSILPEVAGKGSRGVRTLTDDLYDTFHNSLLIVVTRPEVAERIVADMLALFESYAGVFWMSDVGVARSDHF